MILAYGGAAVGAGMAMFLLLSLSFMFLTMLAGGLAQAFVSNPVGFATRLPKGAGFVAILCLIPILLALGINPDLFTASSSRNFVLMFLTPAIPLGCVIGVIVCVRRLRR